MAHSVASRQARPRRERGGGGVFSFVDEGEAGLSKMMIVRQHVLNAEVFHHDHRDAVDKRVLLVDTRRIEINTAQEQTSVDTCDVTVPNRRPDDRRRFLSRAWPLLGEKC